MPKKIIMKEAEELINIISHHADGISLEELLGSLAYSVPKRTLQYRVALLVREGLIISKGGGRNSRYYIKLENPLEQQEPIIPLSVEAKEVQNLISAPIHSRKHVSYQRDFIEAYAPNETFYLSSSILKKLFEIGNDRERGRPAGTYARRIYQRLLIDLSWNSSRLEGNTYSILETEKLLSTGEEAPGKSKKDAQMLLNHKEAIEFIVELAEEIDINRYTILNIHGLLSHDLLSDPNACGRLRTKPVKIGQSLYLPLEIPQL